jgi:hypothetical protein
MGVARHSDVEYERTTRTDTQILDIGMSSYTMRHHYASLTFIRTPHTQRNVAIVSGGCDDGLRTSTLQSHRGQEYTQPTRGKSLSVD